MTPLYPKPFSLSFYGKDHEKKVISNTLMSLKAQGYEHTITIFYSFDYGSRFGEWLKETYQDKEYIHETNVLVGSNRIADSIAFKNAEDLTYCALKWGKQIYNED